MKQVRLSENYRKFLFLPYTYSLTMFRFNFPILHFRFIESVPNSLPWRVSEWLQSTSTRWRLNWPVTTQQFTECPIESNLSSETFFTSCPISLLQMSSFCRHRGVEQIIWKSKLATVNVRKPNTFRFRTEAVCLARTSKNRTNHSNVRFSYVLARIDRFTIKMVIKKFIYKTV